ncbi:acetyltransferase [Vibrio cholerae]|nr:GNAT family N-acetyltransferase [Vibrio cholerae]EEN99272.1 acetyltransferase [Vibrio cholerae 12129(1)]KUO37388.1 acetyltransferase [Vibrio cholerae]
MSVTIATRRTLLIPYTEAFESDFLVLNYCAKNRALMNGPTTVAAAKQLFQRVLHDSSLYAMAVLDNYNREYMGHVFIEFESEGRAELGFLFDKAYWGQGFASEALNAFFPNMCQRFGLQRVVATIKAQHEAARTILQKLGFIHAMDVDEFYGPCSQFVWTAEADRLSPSGVVAEQNLPF